MTVKVAYFSGTGCTEHVANTIMKELQARKIPAFSCNLRNPDEHEEDFDLLLICFVVHASNAPEPVMKWAKKLDRVDKKPAVIVSVSGGGEVTPNLACRVPIKRALGRKNYSVLYEKMLVMPSNWIVKTKSVLVAEILKVLPQKISFMVDEILEGKTCNTSPLLGNRILTILGKVEQLGAPIFGKHIKVLNICTRCSICIRQCPVGNISLIDEKISFSNKCILCLNCIYSCPQKALSPGIGKWVVLEDGFSLKELLKIPAPDKEVNLDLEAKGFLWLGVKRYLSNRSDISPPASQHYGNNKAKS